LMRHVRRSSLCSNMGLKKNRIWILNSASEYNAF
jgi:hypothetical protein